MKLTSKEIDRISTQVYQKYPDVKGIKPTVKNRGEGGSEGFLLTYKTKVAGPGGKKINRIVRAVVSEAGKLGKISTSK
jgi:hypothetical protein